MQKLNEKTAALMDERFGCDKVIALATACGDIPYVRGVKVLHGRRVLRDNACEIQ